jgi:hypothetical protein
MILTNVTHNKQATVCQNAVALRIGNTEDAVILLSWKYGSSQLTSRKKFCRSGACFYGTYEIIMVTRTALSSLQAIEYMPRSFYSTKTLVILYVMQSVQLHFSDLMIASLLRSTRG